MARPEANPHREPGAFGVVLFNGRDFGHLIYDADGLEIEDEWNVQRPVGSSGAVAVFKGTKVAESITFFLESTTAEEFDDLRDLWDMFAPKATSGTGTAAPTLGSTYGIGSPAAKDTPAGGATPPAGGFTIPSGTKGGTSTDADGFPNSKAAGNVGPRPPTVTVEFELAKFIGVLAVARKKWKGPKNTDTNSWRVELTVIQNKPPTPAGVGQQSAAKGSQFTQGATKSQADPGTPLGGAAAAV